jgi:CDP-6-deoxy-D-xylo-4-hexulose-3-dehydrase
MISTDDADLYDKLRMLRSHGMVRESLNSETKKNYIEKYPDLNPDFIFAFPSHNMRSTELNALIGLEQLKRLDTNNLARTKNLEQFLTTLDPNVFQTEFKVEGSSNYAFTLVLREPDLALRDKVEDLLKDAGIEFRRGLSGGGNQLRQPYLQSQSGLPSPESMKVTDHVHHYAWYVGNYPELKQSQIELLGQVLRKI